MDTKRFVSTAIAISGAVHADRRATLLEKTHDVLSEFRTAIPYSSAELAVWDRDSGEHKAVMQVGYEDHVLERLNGEMLVNDLCWPVMWRRRTPTRWRDCGFDPNRSDFFREVLRPNGYKEGLYMPLISADTYVGMFTLNTDDGAIPSDEAVAFASEISPLLVNLLEQRTPSAHNDPANFSYAAINPETGRLSRDLNTGHPVPAAVQESVAAALLAPMPLDRFTSWPESTNYSYAVRLMLPENGLGKPTIRWQAAAPPFELTRRQLEILTLLADGLSNAEIATRLFLSVRTVTTHVERIFLRLGVSGRVAATRLALALGLLLL